MAGPLPPFRWLVTGAYKQLQFLHEDGTYHDIDEVMADPSVPTETQVDVQTGDGQLPQ